MSLEAKKETRSIMRNDLDMVHVEMVSEQEMTTLPFECNLEEILKPPTERFVIFLSPQSQFRTHSFVSGIDSSILFQICISEYPL